jgi:hypothetical protein
MSKLESPDELSAGGHFSGGVIMLCIRWWLHDERSRQWQNAGSSRTHTQIKH